MLRVFVYAAAAAAIAVGVILAVGNITIEREKVGPKVQAQTPSTAVKPPLVPQTVPLEP